MNLSGAANAVLDAWIDFNQDGDWLDAGERIFSAVNVVGGDNVLSFTVPAGSLTGDTYARFRVSSAGVVAAPTGAAPDGEVEDYQVQLIASSQPVSVDLPAGGATEVSDENGTLVVRNNGILLFSAPLVDLAGLNLVGSADNDAIAVSMNGSLPGTLTITGGDDLDSLSIVNNAAGSVYLNLIGKMQLNGVSLNDSGSLFLNQSSGDLTIDGAIEITDGRAVLNTRGALIVNADISATDYIRLVADSIDVNGSALSVTEGDIELRSRGDVNFDATSSLSAQDGSITVISGATLTVGSMVASEQIDLRARGDILRSGGLLTAFDLKMYSQNGQIGVSDADPIYTDVERIDVRSSSDTFVSEVDGIEFGRFGFIGEAVSLGVGSGIVRSVSGTTFFAGSGLFSLRSAGAITLDTGLYATGSGSISISSDSFLMTSRGLLSTNTGSLDIQTQLSMTLSQVRSLSGSIRLESVTGAVVRLDGLEPPTIFSVMPASIIALTQVDLIVDSDQVVINDMMISRDGELFIAVLLAFNS